VIANGLSHLLVVYLARSDMPWQDPLLVFGIGLSCLAIVLGLVLQVWIPAVQFRRFSRIFANRPDAAAQAFDRVLDIYGWRARLALKVFKIPVPPGAQIQS
jgi:hypothetical protein